MTDHGNLFGAVEFYNAAKAKGVQPDHRLRGLRLASRATRSRSDGDRYNHLVLLCENQEGYRNLIKLVSDRPTWTASTTSRASTRICWPQHSKGLIALSACLKGDINETLLGRPLRRGARALAYQYQDIFGPGNFFLEIQDHGLDEDKRRAAAGQPAFARDRHPAGRHQRLPLPAQATTPARTTSCSASRPARP